MSSSLQDRFAPKGVCYGCGPANPQGLRIQSTEDPQNPGVLLARFKPAAFHHAFPGVLNGGIIGTLLDCHCNWTAAYAIFKATGATEFPCTVTADYSIALKRPTPSDQEVELRAWVVEQKEDRAVIEGTLSANGKVTATCRGTFVAVKPGHPAYHRWG